MLGTWVKLQKSPSSISSNLVPCRCFLREPFENEIPSKLGCLLACGVANLCFSKERVKRGGYGNGGETQVCWCPVKQVHLQGGEETQIAAVK